MHPLSILLLLAAPCIAMAQVNLENGSFMLTQADIVLRSSGRELVLQRVYNSRWQLTGSFGVGWGTYYETSLSTLPDGTVLISEHGVGKTSVYLPAQVEQASAASIRSPYPVRTPPASAVPCTRGRVIRLSDGYQRMVCNGTREVFDVLGRLVRIATSDGYTVRVLHEGKRVREIRDSLGRRITLEWSASGRVVAARSGALRIGYDYTRNNLTSVANAGMTAHFAYDSDRRLTEIRIGDALPSRIAYDADTGRVESIVEPNGASARYVVQHDPDEPRFFRVKATLTSPAGEQLSREWEYRIDDENVPWQEVARNGDTMLPTVTVTPGA